MTPRIVSERIHEGGLMVRLVRLPDSFGIQTENDDTGVWWPTMSAAALDQVKDYVSGVLSGAKHDCVALGCSGWRDAPE